MPYLKSTMTFPPASLLASGFPDYSVPGKVRSQLWEMLGLHHHPIQTAVPLLKEQPNQLPGRASRGRRSRQNS
jgi:hypothetical protein